MPIPYRVDDLEKVPEAYRGLYTEKNEQGKVFFIAQVEGVSPKEVVDDFRQNNIALREQNEGLLVTARQWEEIGQPPDVVKANLLRFNEVNQKIEGKELIAAEGFQKALETKVSGYKEEMAGKLTQAEKRALEAEQRASKAEEGLRQFRLDTEISAASIDVGVKAKAMVDVRNRSVGAGWTINDSNVPVLKDANGIVALGKDGYPLTLREWMQDSLYEESEHLFEQGKGGNAPGGANSNVNGLAKYGNVNPWDPKKPNISLQSKIVDENPALADQLARQAGVKRRF